MSRLVLVVGAVLCLSEFAPARAQFVVGPAYPGFSSGFSYSYRSGFGFGFGGSRFRAVGFSGGFVSRSVFVHPQFVPSPFFVPRFYSSPFFLPTVPIYPFGQFVPVSRFGPVVPFGPIPPTAFVPLGAFYPGFGYGGFGYGGFGSGFGYGGFRYGGFGYGFGPPVIVAPPPIILGGGNGVDPDGNALAGIPPPANNAELLPKGAGAGDWLVIAPQKGGTIPAVTRVAPVPPIPVAPFVAPVPVNVEKPEADPKLEAARLVKLGRASFANGNYGRAAEYFTRAIESDPEAQTYFLLGQAKFAAGQYADAVARIRDGLALDPNWPASGFNPADLYGAEAVRFAAHLAALKKTLNENPNQAMLEFLLGYQLWFSGNKAEAEKLFRTAEKRLAAPGPLALFK